MDNAQDRLDNESPVGDMESLGVSAPTEARLEAETEAISSPHMQGDGNSGETTDLPKGVRERLGRQEKRHSRELRALRAEMQAINAQMNHPNAQPNQQGYSDAEGNYQHTNDEQIQRAVAAALQAQEAQARKQREQEQMQHVYRQYENLDNDLNKGADRYEDFDDVVRGNDSPFTSAMRDAALMIPNPADVLYKLGKDKDALRRISQLHPLEQAKEIVKLSHALVAGGGSNGGVKEAKTIGQIKNNPISTTSITDNTPASEIRRRMKSGEWKSSKTTR